MISAVVAVWLVVAAAMLWSAGSSALSGLERVDQLGQLATDDLPTFLGSVGGDTDDVPEETAAAQLRAAAGEFALTEERLDSPVLLPARHMPVIGRQLRSVDALAAAASTTADEGASAFEELNELLVGTAQTPQTRLETAQTTEQVLTDLQTALSGLDLGPNEKLLPPVASARNRFSEEYDTTMATLDTAITAVTGVNSFLEGPTRYLVLGQNNAEMRAGGGMVLQVGTLSVDQGRFEIGEFLPTAELQLDAAGARMDEDLAALWGWLEPTREWRNLGLSPRFDETARMAAEMWAASGRGTVDGVIAIDVIGLQELLGIIGPVEVGGDQGATTISADNVVQDLLLDQYEEFVDERDARRERLGLVAGSIFDTFNTTSWSASGLLRSLQRAGSGRHILLWSNDPTEQAAWQALGASGSLGDDGLMVSVLNRGGNKLDQFLEVDADLTATPIEDGHRVTVQLDLYNGAPRTLPYYVEGPHPNTGLSQGDYLGLVTLTVPAGAGDVSVTGGDLVVSGDDGPSRVLAVEVLLPLGATQQLRFEFDLPAGWETMTVLPSARVPPVTWRSGVNQWTDAEPVPIDIDEI